MMQNEVNVIRENNRNFESIKRKCLKIKINDDLRYKQDQENVHSANQDTLQCAITKLKRKSQVTLKDLRLIKNSLLENEKCSRILLQTPGALKGIVRELTDHDVSRQIEAVGCLCNLACGEARTAATVTRSCGHYLITLLDSLNTQLAVTSAWTLGNLAGSSATASTQIVTLGALSKLVDCLSSRFEDVSNAASYALSHMAYVLGDELSADCLYKIIEYLKRSELTAEKLQLLFTISCHKDFKMETEVLKYIMKSYTKMDNFNIDDSSNVYFFRILANVDLSLEKHNIIVSFLLRCHELKVMLENKKCLQKSILWLLGNLYNFNPESVMIAELLNKLFF